MGILDWFKSEEDGTLADSLKSQTKDEGPEPIKEDSIESIKCFAKQITLDARPTDLAIKLGASLVVLRKMIDDANKTAPVYQAIKEGWSEGAEERATALLSTDEYANIMWVFQMFPFSSQPTLLDHIQAFAKTLEGGAAAVFSNKIWQALNDKLEVDASLLSWFVLKDKGELVVMNFDNVWLCQEVTTTQRIADRIGGYGGPSVRIMPGLWYHFGGSQGHTQYQTTSQTGLKCIDTGKCSLTSHAIYFGGEHSSFRIPYRSIVRFQPYTDAFGVYKDGGKEQVFIPKVSVPKQVAGYTFNLLNALVKRVAA